MQHLRQGKFANSFRFNSFQFNIILIPLLQVTVIPDSLEGTFCRTTLVKNDNHPWFDQKFSFEFLSADLYKRLLISVWNRDTKKKYGALHTLLPSFVLFCGYAN